VARARRLEDSPAAEHPRAAGARGREVVVPFRPLDTSSEAAS